jgi:hypothetical protein
MEENQLNQLKEFYKLVFESDAGKKVMSDLEKRCHYNATTNVRGDSHESAYMEGQRSVLLFIKNMLLNDKLKGK